MPARVLVSEPLAERGLVAMRTAGLEVDVRTGLSREQLLEAVKGARALVIRSATQVTAEVLEAATDLVVIGRAGIGLDVRNQIVTMAKRGIKANDIARTCGLQEGEVDVILGMAR